MKKWTVIAGILLLGGSAMRANDMGRGNPYNSPEGQPERR